MDYTERGLFHYRNKDFLTITTWLTSLGQQNREPKERRRERQGGQMKGTRAAAARPGRARGPRGAAEQRSTSGTQGCGRPGRTSRAGRRSRAATPRGPFEASPDSRSSIPHLIALHSGAARPTLPHRPPPGGHEGPVAASGPA